MTSIYGSGYVADMNDNAPAAPAPAVPLTDADIDRIADAVPVDRIDVHETTWHRRFARAVLSAAAAVREPKPFTKAQLHRLYVNSPELHKDAPSEAAFTRIVQLAEAAHNLGGRGE